MIACFEFRREPSPDLINLVLFTNELGQPAGRLSVPAQLRRELKDAEGVDTAFPLRLESALSLAVYVAALSQRDLVLSGDADVWPVAWGQINYADQGQVR